MSSIRTFVKRPIWSKIIAFGDSLTQHGFDVENGCWLSLISNQFIRQCDVINRGFSGYNTRTLRALAPVLFQREDIADVCCFILLIGTNDSNTSSDKNQYVPLDEYEHNLRAIISYLCDIGLKERMLLLSPPIYFPEIVQKFFLEQNSASSKLDVNILKQYVQRCIQVAQTMNITFFNLFDATKNHPNPQSLFFDGLHFSNDGAKFLFNSILPLLEEKVKNFHGNIKMWYPHYSDIDYNNLETLSP